MAKQSQIKGKQEPKTPASEKRDPAPSRASSGSLQRVATRHSPAAGGESPSHEQIAVRAYQLWEAQGKPAGTDRENWFEAERLLCTEAR